MKFDLMSLPFAEDALEPHISAKTIQYHYGKHHRGYMNKLDDALDDKERRAQSLEEIVRSSEGGLFNLAAQVWNHDFYWQSLDPSGTAKPSKRLHDLIEKSFGSIDTLKSELKSAATGEFGSGWAWLVYDKKDDSLQVTSTTDAETPLTGPTVPLLTIDVWEHAYYLDQQNDRGAYLDGVLDHLVNWQFASDNLEGA